MRAGFVTCVQLGLSCMEAIYSIGGELALAFTLHDHIAPLKSGRVWIDDFCLNHSLPLYKISHINNGDLFDIVVQENLDWLFVIGWSQIACKQVLDAPNYGVLGMHPTLLPEGRGRASIPWAILKNLPQTGVTLFKLDQGVDTGPILAQEVIAISPEETASSLYEHVTAAHISLIYNVWPQLVANSLSPVPQDNAKATSWPGRTPLDGRISSSMHVSDIDRLVRATSHPYPGAFWDGPQGTIIVWEGSMLPADNAIQIPASDGVYWATDFNFSNCYVV